MLTAKQIEATHNLMILIDNKRTALKRKAWFQRGHGPEIARLAADRAKVSDLLTLASLHAAMGHQARSQGVMAYKPQEEVMIRRALEDMAAQYGVQGLEYDAHNRQLSNTRNATLPIAAE